MEKKERLNHNERTGKGKRAAIVGIVANALMFTAKLFVGMVSQSGAILADSVNSLSDSITGIVNFWGFFISGKPADRDHPFGHGRIEYISSLIISGAIILAGFEFLIHSVKGVISPKAIIYEPFMTIILAASVLCKVGMFFYFRKTSDRIKSDSFRGVALDSLSDAGITLVTLIGLIVSAKSGWIIDGYIGILVSVLVMASGFSSAKSSVSFILGKKADPELVKEITDYITENEQVIGVHDIMVHDYGPGRQIASAHIEVSAKMSLRDAHHIADCIEERVKKDFDILMTIHIDPVDFDISECRQ
ncbi:MAG: cation transporter [Clostridiales bacterium]|nr:cation transporter [Clostridiales bacterium]